MSEGEGEGRFKKSILDEDNDIQGWSRRKILSSPRGVSVSEKGRTDVQLAMPHKVLRALQLLSLFSPFTNLVCVFNERSSHAKEARRTMLVVPEGEGVRTTAAINLGTLHTVTVKNHIRSMKADNSTNKRIHIQFHHGGRPSLSSVPLVARRQDLKDFLASVWSEFGTVVGDTYYQREFEFCIVQFQSHQQALFALAGLQDIIQVQVAVQNCVGADAAKAEMAKQLFVGNHPITAEWAAPKVG